MDLMVYSDPIYFWLFKSMVAFKKESIHKLCRVAFNAFQIF